MIRAFTRYRSIASIVLMAIVSTIASWNAEETSATFAGFGVRPSYDGYHPFSSDRRSTAVLRPLNEKSSESLIFGLVNLGSLPTLDSADF